MQKRIDFLFIAFTVLLLSSCQSLTETVLPSPTATKATPTLQSATELPRPTPTFIPVSKESLAGLIISSPILGTSQNYPSVQPPEMILPNGLGVINSEGELIKFSDAGLFVGLSPSGIQITYQHGFEDDSGSSVVDNLFVYNTLTRETVEIFDDLENEGEKTIVSWFPDEKQFIYYNDFLTVLFEAYGYFEPNELFLADVTTGQSKLLIDDGFQFDVSPDQTQIAYATGETIDFKTKIREKHPFEPFGCFQPQIFNFASFSSQPFDVNRLNEKPVCLGYPKWSPDGKKIAWMGYFDDETFRPVIFDLQDQTGTIYDAINQKPERSLMPTRWFFGEPYFGGYFEPDWMDDFTFWTPSYEINVETGKTSIPRILNRPFRPNSVDHLVSPDGSLNVLLNGERNEIEVYDVNGNLLVSYSMEGIYGELVHEELANDIYAPGNAHIVGWSPFPPPSNVGNN